jgi:pectate lyase
MDKFFTASILVSALGAISQVATAAPAFPGAEGFGANATGGRGGRVIKVTNLNDSGTGSLRAAIQASGARIVVFEVSGTINLASQLNITNPNITIAGQTSPGGIAVTGYMTLVDTSNVIIRHMRFRVGSHRIANGANPETLDSFDIWGSTGSGYHENIIVDHCSVGWGVDENFSMAYNLRNVTVSWNLVHEGLMNAGHPKGQHSKGLFVWGKESAPNLTVTLHHNFLAHNYDRNPLINTGDGTLIVDAVNNVTFNPYGGYAMGIEGSGNKVNWIHNYVKRGPSTNAQLYEAFIESAGGTPFPLVYAAGNIGVSRTTQTGSDWTVGNSWQFTKANEGWKATTPWPASKVTATTMSAAYASEVVANAGATKPFRDSVDQKMASDFASGTGSYRQNAKYPADFPTYQNLPAPADNDNDGMADAWESANGLNVGTDDSAGDRDGDGYTNIEQYINFLAADVDVVRPNAPTGVSAQ